MTTKAITKRTCISEPPIEVNNPSAHKITNTIATVHNIILHTFYNTYTFLTVLLPDRLEISLNKAHSMKLMTTTAITVAGSNTP